MLAPPSGSSQHNRIWRQPLLWVVAGVLTILLYATNISPYNVLASSPPLRRVASWFPSACKNDDLLSACLSVCSTTSTGCCPSRKIAVQRILRVLGRQLLSCSSVAQEMCRDAVSLFREAHPAQAVCVELLSHKRTHACTPTQEQNCLDAPSPCTNTLLPSRTFPPAISDTTLPALLQKLSRSATQRPRNHFSRGNSSTKGCTAQKPPHNRCAKHR